MALFGYAGSIAGRHPAQTIQRNRSIADIDRDLLNACRRRHRHRDAASRQANMHTIDELLDERLAAAGRR